MVGIFTKTAAASSSTLFVCEYSTLFNLCTGLTEACTCGYREWQVLCYRQVCCHIHALTN